MTTNEKIERFIAATKSFIYCQKELNLRNAEVASIVYLRDVYVAGVKAIWIEL